MQRELNHQNHDKIILHKRGSFQRIPIKDKRNMITIQHHIDRKCRIFKKTIFVSKVVKP